MFEQLNSTVIYFQSLSTPQVLVADPEAAAIVFKASKVFIKPIEDYAILSFFGPNVVVTEHGEWRRHRKLTSPSFSEVSRGRMRDGMDADVGFAVEKQ